MKMSKEPKVQEVKEENKEVKAVLAVINDPEERALRDAAQE